MGNRNVSVQYAQCSSNTNPTAHWLLFAENANVGSSANCPYCGSGVQLAIGVLKKGFVSPPEVSQGYCTAVPDAS